MNLVRRLRKRSDQFMPEESYSASSYWYDHGGRVQRDDARLLREAADEIADLRAALATFAGVAYDVWRCNTDDERSALGPVIGPLFDRYLVHPSKIEP